MQTEQSCQLVVLCRRQQLNIRLKELSHNVLTLRYSDASGFEIPQPTLCFVGDNETLCRTYGNLAAMFFTKRCYRLSLRCRRAELFYCLSLPGNRHHRLLTALSNLGHALRANGHHSGAILCHRMCALSAQRSADCVAEARELRNVGKNATEETSYNVDSRVLAVIRVTHLVRTGCICVAVATTARNFQWRGYSPGGLHRQCLQILTAETIKM